MDYERQLKLEYLQYERKHRRLETLSEAFFIKDAEKLSGKEQGAYIEILILLSRDREGLGSSASCAVSYGGAAHIDEADSPAERRGDS